MGHSSMDPSHRRPADRWLRTKTRPSLPRERSTLFVHASGFSTWIFNTNTVTKKFLVVSNRCNPRDAGTGSIHHLSVNTPVSIAVLRDSVSIAGSISGPTPGCLRPVRSL